MVITSKCKPIYFLFIFLNLAMVSCKNFSDSIDKSKNKKTQNIYDTIVILGIDGAGSYFQNLEMHNFNEIFQDGNVTYNMRAIPPTSSSQGWGSMFYGTTPIEHGLVKQIVTHRRNKNENLPSIFNLVHESYPDSNIVCCSGWSPICTGIIDQTDGISFYPNYKCEKSLSNRVILDYAISYLKSNKPKLMFVQFDELDEVGHEFGFGSKEYVEKALEIDEQIKEFYDQISSIENSLFIMTTDHGGVDKSHGGNSKEEVNCFFAIKGNNVLTETPIMEMETRDVASIVLYALGVEQPCNYTSRIPLGIWKDIGGGERPVSKISCISELSKYYRTHSCDIKKEFPELLQKKVISRNTFDDIETNYKGFYGNALNCFECSKETDFVWQNQDTISIAFWIKAQQSDGDPVIIANKNWSSGRNPGIAIIQRKNEIIINIGDGNDNRCDFSFPIPYNYWDGWTHYLFIFDISNRVVTGYCDFEELFSEIISPDLEIKNMQTIYPFVIGQDVTKCYNVLLNAGLDEFIIFGDRLNNNEIKALQDYYTDFKEE